ncbi:MAG: hypothetical protein GY822_08150 [Deltaproteobacteria bacterium]|nr:hypothetical protein [Deltaproteobacteria bacterium]
MKFFPNKSRRHVVSSSRRLVVTSSRRHVVTSSRRHVVTSSRRHVALAKVARFCSRLRSCTVIRSEAIEISVRR